MATPAVKIVQDGLAGMMAGKPEEYMSIVDDNIEFSCFGGLLPDDVAIGKSKDGFMKMAGAQGEYMEQVSFKPHSWCGYGPHVGFIVDWEVQWKDGDKKGPIVPLRAVVYKKVNEEGKICQKLHMLDQRACRMVKDSVTAPPEGRAAVEYGPAESTVRTALAGFMAGKPEDYMCNVADNIQFSILGGLMKDEDSHGKSKEEFMGLMPKQGEVFETLSFQPHSFCGYGEYTTFVVQWEVKLKKDDSTAQFHAICMKKTDAENKICEKWHFIDQYYAKMMFA